MNIPFTEQWDDLDIITVTRVTHAERLETENYTF
jgi:hypothetical protein